MGYIIKGGARNWYVSLPGSQHSYTSNLRKARVFKTREAAERDKCGNEWVVNVEVELPNAED